MPEGCVNGNHGSCFDCPVGYFCPGYGSNHAGWDQCPIQCPRGTFTGITNQYACTGCPQGSWSDIGAYSCQYNGNPGYNVLNSGNSIYSGDAPNIGAIYGSQWLNNAYTTSGGIIIFTIQQDGNLVIYRTESEDWVNLWATNTYGQGYGPYRLTLQTDGNLVIFDNNNDVIWAGFNNWPGTGRASYYLMIIVDQWYSEPDIQIKDNLGNIMYSSANPLGHGTFIQSAGTSGHMCVGCYKSSPNGQYMLSMQYDGNLVAYDRHPEPWTYWFATGTWSYPGSTLVLSAVQGEPTLSVRSGNTIVWNNNAIADGSSSYELTIGNDQKIYVKNGLGTIVWVNPS